MKLIQTCIAFVIAVAFVAIVPPAVAQERQSPADSTSAKSPEPVTGELLSINTGTKTLVVKTAADTQMKFTYSDETQIVGGDKGMEGLATEAGSIVTVTYNVHGTANVAIRIEVKSKQ